MASSECVASAFGVIHGVSKAVTDNDDPAMKAPRPRPRPQPRPIGTAGAAKLSALKRDMVQAVTRGR